MSSSSSPKPEPAKVKQEPPESPQIKPVPSLSRREVKEEPIAREIPIHPTPVPQKQTQSSAPPPPTATARKRSKPDGDETDHPKTLPVYRNFIAWVALELQRLYSTKQLAPLYTLPSNINFWSIDHVQTFLHCVGFSEVAAPFAEHRVDGIALMLLTRHELIYGGLKLPLGYAVKLNSYLDRFRTDLADIAKRYGIDPDG